MTELSPHPKPENTAEKAARWYRNINAAAALALAGVAVVIPGPNAILSGWAGLNALQAGLGEAARRSARFPGSDPGKRKNVV